MDNFERSSRKGLKFAFIPKTGGKQIISDSSLWGLKDEELDSIAKPILEELRSSDDSLLSKPSVADADNRLRIKILQHILEVNADKRETAAKREATREKISLLEQRIAQKEIDKLDDLSAKQIKAQLKDLKSSLKETE